MGFLWLTDCLRGKEWNLRFLFALVYMTLIFMLVEYRLIFSFLLIDEPNSRDEYFHATLPFWRSVRLVVEKLSIWTYPCNDPSYTIYFTRNLYCNLYCLREKALEAGKAICFFIRIKYLVIYLVCFLVL